MARAGQRLPCLRCCSWGGSAVSQGALRRGPLLGPHRVAVQLARGGVQTCMVARETLKAGESTPNPGAASSWRR